MQEFLSRTTQNSHIDLQDCLFGLIENSICGTGEYTTFFGLAELFTALGLFAIIYRLREVKWDCKLLVYWEYVLLANIFLVLAVIFSIYSFTIPQIPTDWLLPKNHALFQLLSFLSLLSALGIYIFLLLKRKIFTHARKKIYTRTLYKKLEKTDENIPTVVDIIMQDLPKILDSLELETKDQTTDDDRSALWIFNSLLTDPKIISFLAKNRPGFTRNLLNQIKKRKLTRRDIGEVISLLFEQMIQDSSSHMFRQQTVGGLSHAEPILDTFLGEDDFFLKHHKLISQSGLFSFDSQRQDLKQSTELHLNILGRSMQLELAHGVIFNIFQTKLDEYGAFTSFVRNLCLLINDENDPLVASRARSALCYISSNFANDFLIKLQELLKDKKVSCSLEEKYGVYKANSILDAYILTILNIWQTLSILNDEWLMRMTAMQISDPILNGHYPNLTELKTSFFDVLRNRTKNNIERGTYPNITSTAFCILSWPDTDKFRNDYIDYVIKELGRKIRGNAKMADDRPMKDVLLVNNIYYDKVDDCFYYFYHDGRSKKIESSS